jgi:hypothetical protein
VWQRALMSVLAGFSAGSGSIALTRSRRMYSAPTPSGAPIH